MTKDDLGNLNRAYRSSLLSAGIAYLATTMLVLSCILQIQQGQDHFPAAACFFVAAMLFLTSAVMHSIRAAKSRPDLGAEG